MVSSLTAEGALERKGETWPQERWTQSTNLTNKIQDPAAKVAMNKSAENN